MPPFDSGSMVMVGLVFLCLFSVSMAELVRFCVLGGNGWDGWDGWVSLHGAAVLVHVLGDIFLGLGVQMVGDWCQLVSMVVVSG